MTYSPKEYLLSIGAIKEVGRGRLSKENIELCKQGAAKGISIQGYSISTSKPDADGVTETLVKKEEVSSGVKEVIEPFYRYGEAGVNTHEAVTSDGRVYNLRQACICGYSLSGHICDDPQILTEKMVGHERVTIRVKG